MGKKISELEARTAVTNNDIFVIVDEPGTGSAETAKVTYSTLRDSIIAEAGFNTVGNDQILDPASAGGNVTINADATVNGDFTVYGNTIIDAGSQIVSNPDNPITINPGGTGDTIIESELITNGPITANNNLSVNGDFSVTGNVDGIGLLDLDNANTSKIADGTAGFLLQTDGAGNFSFVQGASTKGTFTDGSGVVYDDQQYDISGITQANPGVMTVASGHNLVTGDSITVTGVSGMTEVNDQSYFVSVNGDELTLYSDSGLTTQVNTTGFSTYISGGVADAGDGAFVPGSGIGSIGDLSDVDTTTNTPSAGDALKWDGTNFVPVASAEIDPDMTPTDGQALVWDDQQYAVDGATQANPVVLTLPTDHNLSDGDAITITGVGGMTELNDQTVYVSVGTNGEVSLYSDAGLTTPIDGSSYSAYTSGGTASAGTGNWVANAAASSVGTLTDVDTTGLADGQILKYNSGNSTWTPMSTSDLLESDDSVPTITDRGQTVTNATFSDGDVVQWDAQGYDINNINASNSTISFTSLDIPGHNYSNGDLITITGVTGMTELNNNQYYVQVLVQNGVAIYTDESLTQHVNSESFGTYTGPSGFAQGSGTWTAKQSTLVSLSDTDTSGITDGQVLKFNASNSTYIPVSVSDLVEAEQGSANTGGVAITNPEGDLLEGQNLTWHTGTITGQFAGGGHNSIAPTWQPGTVWEVGWADPDPAPGTNKGNPDPTDYWGHVGATSRAVIDASDYERIVGRFVGTTTGSGSNNTLNGRIVELLYKGDSSTFRRDYWIIKLDQSTQERLTHANGDYQFFTQSDTNTLINTMQDPQPDAAGFERLHPGTLNAYTGWVSIAEDNTLGGLSNVDDSGIADGQVIKYNASNSTYIPSSISFDNIADFDLIDEADRTDGQALIWDTRSFTITNATQANPPIITLSEDHNIVMTDANVSQQNLITISGVVGMEYVVSGYTYDINKQWKVRTEHANGTPLASNELALYSASYPTNWTPEDLTSATAYVSGGSFSFAGGGKFVLGSGTDLSTKSIDELTDVDTSSSGHVPNNGDFLQWNGSHNHWMPGVPSATVSATSDTPPSNPIDGEMWWESDTGKLKIYYNDGTSSQWVDSFTAGSAADKNIFAGATKEEVNIVASAGSGAVDYDCSTHSIHHLSSMTGDIQANLTNLALAEGYATTISFVIAQGTTARIVDALSIGGTSQTLCWVGGSVPTGTNSGFDVQTFSIIRTGASSYTVLAQLVPFI